MENFGLRLKESRKIKNLRQADLALKLGMEKHNAVSNWENGISKPTADDLQRISEILEVSIDYLLKGEKKEAEEKGAEYWREKFYKQLEITNELQGKKIENLKNIEILSDKQ